MRNRVLLAWFGVLVLALSFLGGCGQTAPTAPTGAEVVPPEVDSTIQGSTSDPNTAAADAAKAAGESGGEVPTAQP